MAIEFNEDTCLNPTQFALDMANAYLDQYKAVSATICDMEGDSIDRDNLLAGNISDLSSAIAAVQAATGLDPEGLEALRALIEENQDAITGIAAQTAANLSTAAANAALIESHKILTDQLSQAQSDATAARASLTSLIDQLTSRVGTLESTVTSHGTRITELENAPTGTGGVSRGKPE